MKLPLSLAALIGMASASAQPTQAQLSVQDSFVAREDARRVADNFGACVTFRFGRAARRIVTDPVPHDDVLDRFSAEVNGSCMSENDPSGAPVRVWLPYPAIHGVLADNLIKREFRRSGPADLSAAPAIAPIPAPPLPDTLAMAEMTERERAHVVAQHQQIDGWLVMQRIGICTARRVPELVRQVALTRVGSDEERAAIRALGPEVGGCIPTGTTVRLRPADLRMAVALGYYRLASALPGGAAAGSGGE